MLRYAPAPEGWSGHSLAIDGSPHAITPGGAEYNVACALARIGRDATWVSAVPDSATAELQEPEFGELLRSAESAGVRLELVESAHPLGTYRVRPEISNVEYDRSDSAFAHLEPGAFDWRARLSGARWLVLSGITPLLGEGPLANWSEALTLAELEGTLVALDLNHRPQLGSFEDLWSIVESRLRQVHLLVISPTTLHQLARRVDWQHPLSAAVLEPIRSHWNIPYVACCSKSMTDDGGQLRWSDIAHTTGSASSAEHAVTQTPAEALGGGDAWLAGCLDGLLDELELEAICQRADLLAALTQQTFGDLGEVTREQLSRWESIEGRANIAGTG